MPNGAAAGPAGENALVPRGGRGLQPFDPARARARRGRDAHRRFAPPAGPHPGWATAAPQRHVRALAAGAGGVWAATWGGVLCWTPADGRVERHGSEHGLAGNAARAVAVDAAGTVWAGQDAGLAWLDPAAGWRAHAGLAGRAVLRLAARAAGGVWVAVRDAAGRGAVGHVAAPGAPFRAAADDPLACTDPAALLDDGAGGVWTATAWGAFRCRAGAAPAAFTRWADAGGAGDVPVQVQALALAPAADGGVWVGTNWGLYAVAPALDPTAPAAPAAALPVDPVRALARAWDGEALLVATDGAVGVLDAGAWQPLAGGPAPSCEAALGAPVDGAGRLWAAGADGVWEVRATGLVEAFPPAPEDAPGGLVRALAAARDGAWAGTARGLYRYDASDLRAHAVDAGLAGPDAPAAWDVRALASADPDPAAGACAATLWAGTWGGGVRRLADDVSVPGGPAEAPVVAVAADGADGAWFATPDAVHHARADDAEAGCRVPLPPGAAGQIVSLCYQPADPPAGRAATLWIGTGRGLLGWQPALRLWAYPAGVPAAARVHALARDPRDGRVWAGTSEGLYAQPAAGPDWRRHADDEVRALAFGPAAAPGAVALWAGTRRGLARWTLAAPGAPDDGPAGPAAWLTAAASGLAADDVTALLVREAPGGWELWVGSPAGVSRYRHPPGGRSQ